MRSATLRALTRLMDGPEVQVSVRTDYESRGKKNCPGAERRNMQWGVKPFIGASGAMPKGCA